MVGKHFNFLFSCECDGQIVKSMLCEWMCIEYGSDQRMRIEDMDIIVFKWVVECGGMCQMPYLYIDSINVNS